MEGQTPNWGKVPQRCAHVNAAGTVGVVAIHIVVIVTVASTSTKPLFAVRAAPVGASEADS